MFASVNAKLGFRDLVPAPLHLNDALALVLCFFRKNNFFPFMFLALLYPSKVRAPRNDNSFSHWLFWAVLSATLVHWASTLVVARFHVFYKSPLLPLVHFFSIPLLRPLLPTTFFFIFKPFLGLLQAALAWGVEVFVVGSSKNLLRIFLEVGHLISVISHRFMSMFACMCIFLYFCRLLFS